MGHEKPVEPFSDLHYEDGMVRAVLLHDPTVEGLDMAIYMDASGSMSDEYQYTRPSRTFLEWLRGAPLKEGSNQVEPQVQWMLEYLATKDRNGLLRVAYGVKGHAFYQHNPWFHAKLGLFVLAAVLSILPTVRLLRWRRALKADPGFLPDPAQVGQLRRLVRLELAAVAAILVCAAAMARYGGF